MKKMFFIVGLTTICLTSCVKDYTCKCTATDASIAGITVDCEIQ